MALEHENNVAVLGRFGEACEGSMLDWRRRCPDEILWGIPMVLVDQHLDGLPYRALINSRTSINFRQLWQNEGGTDPNCCPSTANSETEICDFVMPELQYISVGVEPRCYFEWEREFCKVYPRFKGCSPFVVSGGQITLLPHERDESKAFMSIIKEELAQAIWEHIYRTAWVGRDEHADEWNGLFYYFENGIAPRDQTPGGCNYPLTPTTLNICEYIHGTAACEDGACAGPGDCILAVDDPDRPGDAPADNIWTIYPGTQYETSIDLTGFDTIDILRAWWRLVVKQWGVQVIEWLLGVPPNTQTCLAEVAACKQACQHGDCRHLLTADTRDEARATREARMIEEEVIRIYPHENVAFPMRQSEALAQTNKLLFLPERYRDGEGNETYWMLWAWRNRAAERENLLSNVPQLRQELGLHPGRLSSDFEGFLYDGQEFQPGRLLDSTAWEWLSDRNCNSVRWWNNAECGMIPQCPHLWLIIDGICCDSVLTLPCPSSPFNTDDGQFLSNPNQWLITDCNDVAAPPSFNSGLEVVINDNNLSGYQIGDEVDYLTDENYTLRGTITAFAGGSPTSTMTIGFEETGVLCANNGGATDGYIRDAVG